MLILPRPAGRQDIAGDFLFLEEVAEQINDVDRLVFTAGDGTVSTLVRGQAQWTVTELAAYPAHWNKLKILLADLARAEIVEFKTDNPDYFARLGVEDVSDKSAQGTLLEIFRGERLAAIIAGNDAGSLAGQYLRIADQAQSVLIDRSLDVSADPLDWADTEVVNIGSSQVAELEILHPDGNRIRIGKLSADDPDFSLEDLPENRELLSSWSVNSLANVFSMLRMDSVVADTGAMAGEFVEIRLLTFSGLEIRAEAFEQDESGWVRIKARAQVQQETNADDEQASRALQEQNQTADEINKRTGGWLYRVPATKFQTMTTRFEQLLKPLDGEPDAEGG
jgi:hypothetical protein